MKKIILALFFVPFFVSAQAGTPATAGLTPQSPFYFFDRLAEAMQGLIAFSPEAKIRLQVTLAAERIAEIKLDLEAKDVDAKGLAVAQERLQKHLARAARLIDEEEQKGKDVKEWKEALKEEFEASEEALEDSFDKAEELLETEEEALEEELEAAERSGDDGLAQAIKSKLQALEVRKDELELMREEQEATLENEEAALDEEGDDDADEEDREDDEEESEDEDREERGVNGEKSRRP